MSDTLRIVLTLYPEADLEDTSRWPGDDEACDAALNAIPSALIGDDIIIRSMTAEVVRAAAEQPAAPIDMVLHCPACGLQHVDAAESDAAYRQYLALGGIDNKWDNAPHRSHLCRPEDGGCGHIWRPADVPTNGVAAVKTKGKDDSPIHDRAPPGPAQPGAAKALEFAEYMAKGAERYLDAVVADWEASQALEDDDENVALADAARDAAQTADEHARGLRSAIYEFRKRAAKSAAPLPAVPQPALSQEEQWSRAGFEPYKFHPSASHVEPAYRDGWNAALRAVERAATPQPDASAGAQADRKLLEALSQYISAVLSELQFERGTGSLAAHNLRLCLIEVMKALDGTRDSAMSVGVGFPLSGAQREGWISVGDQMPEPDMGEVLVWLTGGPCAIDEWHMHREDPTGMGGPTMDMGFMWREYDSHVTHWMPLPAAPGAAPTPATPGETK